MDIKNVIVTDGHYLHAVGIVRYLGKNNLSVFTIGIDSKPILEYSKYCK